MAYTAHRAFVAPALPTPELGRLAFGIVAIELLYRVTHISLTESLGFAMGDGGEAFAYGTTPLGLALNLFAFVFLGLWVVLIAQRQHGRGLVSLVGPFDQARRHFVKALIAISLLFMLDSAIPPWGFGGAADQRPLLEWSLMLPVALIAIFIQIGAEEIFYRGYIQQQLAARFDSPWVWLVVPNLLFAAGHFDSGQPLDLNVQYLIWTFCFGLAASDLTARAGNLGPALAFHFANNAYAFLFFAETDGADSGLALWLFPPSPEQPMGPQSYFPPGLLIEIFLLALMWGAARISMRR